MLRPRISCPHNALLNKATTVNVVLHHSEVVLGSDPFMAHKKIINSNGDGYSVTVHLHMEYCFLFSFLIAEMPLHFCDNSIHASI